MPKLYIGCIGISHKEARNHTKINLFQFKNLNGFNFCPEMVFTAIKWVLENEMFRLQKIWRIFSHRLVTTPKKAKNYSTVKITTQKQLNSWLAWSGNSKPTTTKRDIYLQNKSVEPLARTRNLCQRRPFDILLSGCRADLEFNKASMRP